VEGAPHPDKHVVQVQQLVQLKILDVTTAIANLAPIHVVDIDVADRDPIYGSGFCSENLRGVLHCARAPQTTMFGNHRLAKV
jgi:hypothetical protein